MWLWPAWQAASCLVRSAYRPVAAIVYNGLRTIHYGLLKGTSHQPF